MLAKKDKTFRPGSFIVSRFIDSLILWFTFHLSLFCLLYLTVETFRRYLNRQGRLGKELSANSYYVYIIHTIVLGALALMLLDAPLAPVTAIRLV
ncbi:MAG: hypothetical protein JW993_15445 [Sedimentisphaerales bacterium]|nr:hypothetical protein [Sedimentisphaerales bacterium]